MPALRRNLTGGSSELPILSQTLVDRMMGRMVPIDVDQRDVFSIAKKPRRRRRRNGRRRYRKAQAATDQN
jgi:hypothetical protein